jgi:hypothetical protein
MDRAGAAFGASARVGVLLLGNSGVGKSDLALRLIALGARLVSDDRTELFIADGKLYGRAPRTIAGLIEARGIGIVKLPHAARARIALAVMLTQSVERLPSHDRYKPPLKLAASACPPLIKLIAFEASAPAKVALATAAFERGLFCEDVNTI